MSLGEEGSRFFSIQNHLREGLFHEGEWVTLYNAYVIPAQAGIQKFFLSPSWIPACAGMTWVELKGIGEDLRLDSLQVGAPCRARHKKKPAEISPAGFLIKLMLTI